MTPYFYAIDEFFPPYEFELLRDYAFRLEYKDHVAPFDGVTYPNIGLPVPGTAVERLALCLSWLLGYKVVPKHVAFRLSVWGSKPPQWVHSDAEVARYGMFLHMNPSPPEMTCGTALMAHGQTGMCEHPKDEDELLLWRRDYDDTQMWRAQSFISSAPNRAVILRSDLLHAAMPKGGYGEGVKDGRLILLCFFD
jgi:hypothetical protein